MNRYRGEIGMSKAVNNISYSENACACVILLFKNCIKSSHSKAVTSVQ